MEESSKERNEDNKKRELNSSQKKWKEKRAQSKNGVLKQTYTQYIHATNIPAS
jgi:hypothetical protein